MASKHPVVTDIDAGDDPLSSASPPASPPLPPLPTDEPPPRWSAGHGTGNGLGTTGSLHSSSTNRLGRRYSLGRQSRAENRRLSSPRGLLAASYRLLLAVASGAHAAANHTIAFVWRLQPLQRVLFVLGAAAALTALILMLVYSHRVFAVLGPVAQGWRDLRGGWVLVWLIIVTTAFPPIIGYSTACTLAGIVYGFPWGWPLAATASVVGSVLSFLASRGVLSRYVDRLVGQDRRFVALGHVLRHDGLWVLAAVRFCPLPYSLSNGFLATVPSITPLSFALSTAMATPKLLVHVFIGSRLAKLAEEGDTMSGGDKAINYLSMLVFGVFGACVGLLVYRRTMARAAQLEDAEAAEEGRARRPGGGGSSSQGSGSSQNSLYADSENEELMDPDDADVAALMDDDDISLWATEHFADGDGSGDADDHDDRGPAPAYSDHSEDAIVSPAPGAGKQ